MFQKLKKSRQPKNLGKSPRGPSSNWFYRSAPKHPQLHGIRQKHLFRKKNDFFSQKNQIISDFFRHFLNDQ